MDIGLPERIDRGEWMKLLHVSGSPDQQVRDQILKQMDEAEEKLLAQARPRGIYRVLDREDVATEGVSIEKHLEGCDRVCVMAVTIGAGIDQLISRAQITSMALAVILDAGASVLAEQTADAAEKIIKEELAVKLPGTFASSRFSPGYGDYPIRHQREILTSVDAHRKIGLTLTAGDLLVPHKSITALIGLSDHPVKGRRAPCSECLLWEKCDFLKRGEHC